MFDGSEKNLSQSKQDVNNKFDIINLNKQNFLFIFMMMKLIFGPQNWLRTQKMLYFCQLTILFIY